MVPSLQLPQKLLVDFLSGGKGYDDDSVVATIREGNERFRGRQLRAALDAYGVAYEIGRLHYVYVPLMHDLIVWRIVCLSMLGDFERALQEAAVAMQVVPHCATTYLLCAVLHAKLRHNEEANENFQRAVGQSRLLRDVVECFIALFVQAQQGSSRGDRAIQLCSEVLKRNARFPLALLVRGNAYRFHPSGYFEKQAAADFTALEQVAPALRPFIGERLTLESHSRIDEVLLRCHPWLQAEAPRAYDEYLMFARRPAFFLTSLVLLAVTRLKTLVRSRHLVRSAREKCEELLRQRAAVERRMQELIDMQRQLAEYESHAQVWGPADPDHASVRPYRRYWMECPANFPKRETMLRTPLGSVVKAPAAGATAGAAAAQPAAPPVLAPRPRTAPSSRGRGDTARSSSMEPKLMGAVAVPTATGAVATPAPGSSVSGRSLSVEPTLRLSEPRPTPPSPQREARPQPRSGASEAPARVERVFVTAPSAEEVDGSMCREAMMPGAPPKVEAAPRLGQGWDLQQWALKALELADTDQDAGNEVDLATTPVSALPPLPSSRCIPEQPRAVATGQRLRVRRNGNGQQDEEDSYIDAVERGGFHSMPAWYDALDRIYTITDMVPFSAQPEPFVGLASRAGAPGYSFLVPRRRSQQV